MQVWARACACLNHTPVIQYAAKNPHLHGPASQASLRLWSCSEENQPPLPCALSKRPEDMFDHLFPLYQIVGTDTLVR
jgi:hypothetical protein